MASLPDSSRCYYIYYVCPPFVCSYKQLVIAYQDLLCDAIERSSLQEFAECLLSKVFLRVGKERASKILGKGLLCLYIPTNEIKVIISSKTCSEAVKGICD